MIRKMSIMLLILTLIVGLAGCKNKNDNLNKSLNDYNNVGSNEIITDELQEDNQELVDILNKSVDELLEYSKTNEYKVFKPGSLSQVYNQLIKDGISNYEFKALCDKKFTEKVETGFTFIKEKYIPNYDGKCKDYIWVFEDEEDNDGSNLYVLVKDINTNDYYSVKITFKRTKHYNKDKYYPVFSNSVLLK